MQCYSYNVINHVLYNVMFYKVINQCYTFYTIIYKTWFWVINRMFENDQKTWFLEHSKNDKKVCFFSIQKVIKKCVFINHCFWLIFRFCPTSKKWSNIHFFIYTFGTSKKNAKTGAVISKRFTVFFTLFSTLFRPKSTFWPFLTFHVFDRFLIIFWML